MNEMEDDDYTEMVDYFENAKENFGVNNSQLSEVLFGDKGDKIEDCSDFETVWSTLNESEKTKVVDILYETRVLEEN